MNSPYLSCLKTYWAEIWNLRWLPPNILLPPILVLLRPSLILYFQYVSMCNVIFYSWVGPQSRSYHLLNLKIIMDILFQQFPRFHIDSMLAGSTVHQLQWRDPIPSNIFSENLLVWPVNCRSGPEFHYQVSSDFLKACSDLSVYYRY